MKPRTLLNLTTVLFTCMMLCACTKDKTSCSSEQEFCMLINSNNFEATGPLINDYLAGLKKNKSNENLKKLVNWLECKTCVNKSEILCYSCIETNPPQSEISVDFISNGQTVNMTLDIIMDEHLEFRAYH